jgi:hypothetical protein
MFILVSSPLLLLLLLLLQVPLSWQVPLGMVEYACLTLGCDWLNAMAGRPPDQLPQYFWDLIMSALLPTALMWWWSKRTGREGVGAWGQGMAAEEAAPALAGTHKTAHKGYDGSPNKPVPGSKPLAEAACECSPEDPCAGSGSGRGSSSSRVEAAVTPKNSRGDVGPPTQLDDAMHPVPTVPAPAAAATPADTPGATPPQCTPVAAPEGTAVPAADTDRAVGGCVGEPLRHAAAATPTTYRPYVQVEYVPVTQTCTLAFKVGGVWLTRVPV